MSGLNLDIKVQPRPAKKKYFLAWPSQKLQQGQWQDSPLTGDYSAPTDQSSDRKGASGRPSLLNTFPIPALLN